MPGGAGHVAKLVECLPSLHKVLGSALSMPVKASTWVKKPKDQEFSYFQLPSEFDATTM